MVKKLNYHEIEFKLNCVKSTMEFEDMKLPVETVNLYRQVLNGECSIEAARKIILREHLGL